MQSNHSTPQDALRAAMEAPTRPPAPRDVPPPASLPIDGFPQPLPALTEHLSAILAHLFESAALCQGQGNLALTRSEIDPDGLPICPAFDTATQIGATLLLRRGLPVGFTEAHAALETVRDLLRCPKQTGELLAHLTSQAALRAHQANERSAPSPEASALPRPALLAIALCDFLEESELFLLWHGDDSSEMPEEDPRESFARVYGLTLVQVAALVPAALALRALETNAAPPDP